MFGLLVRTGRRATVKHAVDGTDGKRMQLRTFLQNTLNWGFRLYPHQIFLSLESKKSDVGAAMRTTTIKSRDGSSTRTTRSLFRGQALFESAFRGQRGVVVVVGSVTRLVVGIAA